MSILSNTTRSAICLAGAILCSSPLATPLAAQSVETPNMDWWQESMEHLDERMGWWEEARLALFIHWGAYSVLGGEYEGEKSIDRYAEHIARELKIPKSEYIEFAASRFQPDDFNAEEWVLRAKKAGMKYVVITAKHHDGFAIYPSKYSDFDIEDTAGWERDPLRELTDACAKHGLKFGVYYSHAQDWYEPGNFRFTWEHPFHPTDEERDWYNKKGEEGDAHRERVKEYINQKCIPQLRELLVDYNAEMIWFDTPGWLPAGYLAHILKAVREIKPETVVSYRIGRGYGDYGGGPDNPTAFPPRDERYWEAIQSTLHSWGYHKNDEHHRRSPEHLIRMTANVVARGGNMMINVGPKPDGTWVEKDIETFDAIAEWIEGQEASIHGAGKSPLPFQNWGVISAEGDNLYLHVLDWPKDGKLRVGGLLTDVQSATLMKGNQPLKVTRTSDTIVTVEVPSQPPHPVDSVIQLTCVTKPKSDGVRLIEPEEENRLHVYDGASIFGDLKAGVGRGEDAYLRNWVSAEDAVSWRVRAAETGSYEIYLVYGNRKGPGRPFDNKYEVTVGTAKFIQETTRFGNSDPKYATEESLRMGFESPNTTFPASDKVGVVTLTPGVYDLKIASADGATPKEELFRPRAIFLVPAKDASEAVMVEPTELMLLEMKITGDFKPTEGAIELKAEAADLSGSNAVYRKQGFDEYITRWKQVGERLEWTFQVKQPGDYEVGIAYACPAGNKGSSVELRAGDQKLTFTVGDTGTWNDFASEKVGTMHFAKAGSYTMLVDPKSVPGSGVMNLHHVFLNPAE
ncbi:alpha-L-fucosidase [Coraliomargarita algicola]|uniref:alpha-L-fucosidase n=1 Tax=Coraliomargarita algicola TaxID=3092156 RepID=A0ABZ0RVT2_9BACT|nr:alpha-L-fucosidase [Coraliomargarita sp. J2-16]WPJ97084.1 alpha-L-fucosidase [Coraliomargarita sp. J2-16]